jgi:hypothetical protein
MTSDQSGESATRRGWLKALSWFRVGKYVRNILLFEQTVEDLKQQNKELDLRVRVICASAYFRGKSTSRLDN